jgi:hypothetical protein
MAPNQPSGPIFIVGTERSGSNLLRLILNAHPRIAVPHPPHVLRYFAPLEASYGDLSRRDDRARLADDVRWLLRVHIHPWDPPIDREALIGHADPPDLLGIFFGLYDQFLRAEGKARWGCKSTFAIHHVDRLRRHRPDARFLWLVRDPRDVAASSRRSVFSPFHPYLTACLWRDQQELGLALQARLPADCWLRMRYEDLLADPEGSVRSLCRFLGEPFEPGMLAYHRTDAAQAAAALSEDWRNTTQPVLQGNAGKYRSHLSGAEIRLVETVAGRLMEELDYAAETDGAAPLPAGLPARLAVRLADARWRAGVELRSLRTDRNHWRRWERDAVMGWLRWRRR